MNLRMIGRKALKRCGFPRKKREKVQERKQWEKEWPDDYLYPELEEDND
jgi:hypothetical protein